MSRLEPISLYPILIMHAMNDATQGRLEAVQRLSNDNVGYFLNATFVCKETQRDVPFFPIRVTKRIIYHPSRDLTSPS